MNHEFDLSVIVTAHDETLVCGPTMRAADAAIACAENAGFVVERIIALDNATPETKAWFSQDQFTHWTRMEFKEGDLGRVRNAVLPLTKGRFIAFLDSDDLFSENWLALATARLQNAAQQGKRAIAHPELNWLFDGAHSVYLKPDQASAMFSPWYFYTMNYYDSLCMAPREAHLENQYVHRDIPAGLSFQDWQFSIETMSAGWEHISVRDTIIFKRRRDNSLVNESRTRRAVVRQIEAMAIDRVEELGRNVEKRSPRKFDQRTLSGKSSKKRTAKVWIDRFFKTPPAPPPDPKPKQVPHFGPGFAKRVEQARDWRGARPKEVSASLYEEAHGFFDYAYYLALYPDIRSFKQFDPLAHYLRQGWKEGRNPAPWFSTNAYLDRYPDVDQRGENPFLHWLTKGRNADYLPQPVMRFETIAQTAGLTPEEAFSMWHDCYFDLRNRLEQGALGAQVVRAALFDPLVEQGWMDALTMKIAPFHSDQVCLRTAEIFDLAQSAGMRRARHVICVNRARFGSAPRVEGHLARALADRYGAHEVLLITTDGQGAMPAGKLPKGVRHVDFAALVPNLRGDARQRLLAEFLRALHPDCVFNVNSRLFWDMLTPYGSALSHACRLYTVLLCNEQTDLGHWTGYPLRRFYRHFNVLSGVITDSAYLAKDLTERYCVPPDKACQVQVLPNPVDAGIPIAKMPANTPDRRPQVFWAGRFDAQKRLDLVIEIAADCPEIDFRLWGASVMSDNPFPDALPANILRQGSYERFSDLPLDEADAWLYTSAWDGVPTMLLEVAMTGVPLVGGLVGGTGEVLLEDCAHGVPDTASSADWANALRTVIENPNRARAKAEQLRSVLIKERTKEAYATKLFELLNQTRSVVRAETGGPGCDASVPHLSAGKA